MLTTDMADTAVDMDMVDTDMADTVVDTEDTTVANDLPLPKLIPMLKPKLTVMAVDMDMEVMVDTVVMEVTDMVDTVARGLQKKKQKKINQKKLNQKTLEKPVVVAEMQRVH